MSEISIFKAAKRVVYESRKVYERYPGLLEKVAKLGVPEDDPFNAGMVDLENIVIRKAMKAKIKP
jgi:replication fork clamp-binding protein CrfC